MRAVYRCGEPGYIYPGSPEHSVLISPSKVASILGVSRWESAYALWHRMKGMIEPKAHQDIFDTGTAMEQALAMLWRLKNPGWRLSSGEVQYVTDEFGFPALATVDRRASRGRGRRIVEFKIARDLNEWGDPDLTDDQPPEDYQAQVIAQQTFSGIRRDAHLMVMGPFFNDRIYTIPFDPVVSEWIVEKSLAFYESLKLDTPPPLDNTVSCYETVRELHPDIDGTTVEVPADMAKSLLRANIAKKDAEADLRFAKTVLMDHMKNAQYATHDGVSIARRQPHARAGVALYVL